MALAEERPTWWEKLAAEHRNRTGGRPQGHLSGPLDVGPHVSKSIPGAELGPKAEPPCPPLEPVPTPQSLAMSLRASQGPTRSLSLRHSAPNGLGDTA